MKPSSHRLFVYWKHFACLIALLCLLRPAVAQPFETSLGTLTYEQNFDGLGVSATATVPDGWVLAQGVGLPVYTNALNCEVPPHRFTTNLIPVNCRDCTRAFDGANGGAAPTGGGRVNYGDLANYTPGLVNDRSIGFMSLNSTAVGSTTDYRSPTNYIMFGFTNNTGGTIISLAVTNKIKVYRQNTFANPVVAFFYSYDGANWSQVNAGTVGPFPAAGASTYYFNDGPIVSNANFTVTGLAVPNGTPFYVCWQMVIANNSGSFSHGMGLDDVGLVATLGTPVAIPTSVWPGGSGNWSASANWQGNTLPVSSNRIVFAGAGGSVNHDLAALATGAGYVRSLAFSNAASASYVLSGNPLSLLGGITNNSTFNQTINNALTLTEDTTFRAATGVLTIGGNITNNGVSLSFDTTPNSTLSGAVSGSGGFTKLGAGVLTLTGGSTYDGPTLVTTGILRLGAANRLPTNNDLSVTSTFDLNGFNQTLDTVTGGGTVALGAGTLTLGAADGTASFGGVISGSGGLTKIGTGTQTLTGSASTYSGATTISNGVLALSNVAIIGDGAVTLAGGTLQLTGTRDLTNGILANGFTLNGDAIVVNTTTATAGTRNFPFAGPVTANAGTLTIQNIATGNFTNVMNLRFHNAGFTWTRPIVFDNSLAGSQVNNTSQLDCSSSNGTPAQIFSGVISGPGRVRRSSLIVGDAGTTILSGNNTYTFGTTLDRGLLGLGLNSTSAGDEVISGPIGTGVLDWTGNSGLFAHGGARSISNYVLLNGVREVLLTGTNQLTLAGPLNVGGVSKNLTVDNTALTIFAGPITNTAALTKSGPGTLVLAADNQNTGGWTVTNGTLRVSNPTGTGTGSGAVIVTAPGILGGTGTIAGPVSGNGSIAPGASAGILTLGDGLDLSTGGTLVWELAASSTASPGVNFDQLALTGGNLVLGGTAKISINFTGSAPAPDAGNPFWQASRSWRVLTIGGAAANPGNTTFATVVNGSFPAGNFSTTADVNGILLTFTPGAGAPPPPVISPNIVGAGTASATVAWSSVAGYTYTVQYRTNLNQIGWLTLGTAPATGATTAIVDNSGPHAERYYRVVWP
jgi:autotransporter-associated beta strand protein